MVAIEKLAYLILGVFAFIIIVVGIFLLARNLYSNISFFFEEEKILEANKQNIDILLRNIEACDDVKDDLCVCEIFPNFPASLGKEFSLVSRRIKVKEEKGHTTIASTRNITIEQKLKKDPTKIKTIDSRKIKNKFGSFLNGKIIFDIYNMVTLNEFEIYFWYPIDYPVGEDAENKIIIVSPYAIKEKAIYFIALNFTFFNFVKFDMEGENEKIENVSKMINDKIKDFPVCKEGRKKSIDFFEISLKKEFKNMEDDKNEGKEKEIDILLDSNFYISINNNKVSLLDDEGNVVKKINNTLDRMVLNNIFDILPTPFVSIEEQFISLNTQNFEKEINEKWKSEEMKFSYNNCNDVDLVLKNGDTIRLKKEKKDGGVCISVSKVSKV